MTLRGASEIVSSRIHFEPELIKPSPAWHAMDNPCTDGGDAVAPGGRTRALAASHVTTQAAFSGTSPATGSDTLPATGRATSRSTVRAGRGAFTLLELLVVLGIIAVLASILIPYLRHLSEMSRRQECSNNLRQIREAIQGYLSDSHGMMPRVRYDQAALPQAYTAFTGADDADPFAATSTVAPNDVTASLWLLVRTGKVTDTGTFVCPSSNDQRDPMLTAQGQRATAQQRGNFRSSHYLSYSYASPFSIAPQYKMSDTQAARFALLADRNPGISDTGDVTKIHPTDPPLTLAQGNSRNHKQAGQNVLYADGHVDFVSTPFCGERQDNIYTALSKTVMDPAPGPTDAVNLPGYLGHDIGPSWASDSYLVPTSQDKPTQN